MALLLSVLFEGMQITPYLVAGIVLVLSGNVVILGNRRRPVAESVDLNGPCVFQREKVCGVHGIRPLGCRVFYCQEEAKHKLALETMYDDYMAEMGD